MLADIDFDHLRAWGHYRMLVGMHGRIHGRITDPILNAGHLSNLENPPAFSAAVAEFIRSN